MGEPITFHTTEIGVFILANLLVWLVQFVALKTDTRWIKKRLEAGDYRLAVQDRRLNRHQANISAIKATCSAHHGISFPDVNNGDSDGGG